MFYTDEFQGKITYLSEMRDTVGLTAITQGADPATLTQAEFDAALAKVDTAIKSGIVRQVAGGSYIESMAAGDVVLAMAWSGDVAGLLVPDQTAEQDFQWVLADEGGMLWTDNMAIPLGSARTRWPPRSGSTSTTTRSMRPRSRRTSTTSVRSSGRARS